MSKLTIKQREIERTKKKWSHWMRRKFKLETVEAGMRRQAVNGERHLSRKISSPNKHNIYGVVVWNNCHCKVSFHRVHKYLHTCNNIYKCWATWLQCIQYTIYLLCEHIKCAKMRENDDDSISGLYIAHRLIPCYFILCLT